MGEVALIGPELVHKAIENFQLIRESDLSTIVPLDVKENLSYEEVPVVILDWQVKKSRNKEVASVKVLWRNQLLEGDTWEAKADMISRYPHLFPSTPTLA
ncbi:hypothetical protein MTR67_034830 [Solanum verrucosum]|uniref:Chromo domain-containing protein n=1 Tax=Solanum verrucosum TaxID=315347 RepID=A0AAF0U938_SOLVR|nr:hypothetical protein MTR67_034830 [Solanum verrucosum]